MAILDNSVFQEWSAAFDNLERARSRCQEAEKLHHADLLAFAEAERVKANTRYLSAVLGLDR